MTEPSQLTACCVDSGLFLPLALKLAPSFKRMLYWSEWMEAFPTINRRMIGDGFPELERIDDIWTHKNEVDLWIFPDIQRAGLQLELEAQGRMVWGSRNGERLETNRSLFLKVLEEVGLPVPKHEKVVGLTALSDYLRDREDVFIKISKYRGSLETCHWRSWREDEGMLDAMAVKFGPLKDLMTFIVFDAINGPLELGCDTFCIDGQWPDLVLNGLEMKDKGYLASVMARDEMPQEVQDVLDAFGPVMAEYRYRNQFSAEIRPPYFIDPCCRFPLPGSGAQMELVGNLAEMIVAGAQGELVQPVMTAPFAAECVLTQKTEKRSWGIVDFSPEVRPFVKCGDSCQIDGRICFPPDETHGEEIGWLFATGDTIKETVETMKERVKLLPDGVHACTDALFDLLKEASTAEDQGVPISTEPIPEPEVALDETP